MNVSDYGVGSRSQLTYTQQQVLNAGDTPDGIAHNEGSALHALSCFDNATAAGLEQDHFRGQEQGIAMIEDIIDGP